MKRFPFADRLCYVSTYIKSSILFDLHVIFVCHSHIHIVLPFTLIKSINSTIYEKQIFSQFLFKCSFAVCTSLKCFQTLRINTTTAYLYPTLIMFNIKFSENEILLFFRRIKQRGELSPFAMCVTFSQVSQIENCLQKWIRV